MIDDVKGDVKGDVGDWSDNFSRLRMQIDAETDGAYSAFRRTLAPRYTVVWRDLLLGWAFVVVAAVALVVAQTRLASVWAWLVVPVGSFLLGVSFHFIGLFLHEAAHNGLAPSRAINDRLTNVFVAPLVLSDIRAYRPVHLDHHRFLGTARDSERTYTERLSAQFVLAALSGVYVLQVLHGRSAKGATRARLAQSSGRHLLVPAAGALGHAGVVVVALVLGWWWLAVAWVLALGSWFPCFGALRQLLEHRPTAAIRVGRPADALGAYTWVFSGHATNALFGGAGFNRHLIHHWEPGVSYTRLADLEQFLDHTSAYEVLTRRRSTYIGTARTLVATGG